ncbi:MAG: GNAT family N-acetyltransferase [Anaerolineae bacterium]
MARHKNVAVDYAYRMLAPRWAADAAEIHAEGQPHTVLTRLGHRFLTEFYRHQCESDYGACIGAFDGQKLIGIITMGLPNTRLFAEFKRKRLWRVAPAVVLQMIRHPNLLGYLGQSWRYTDIAESPDNEADVLFLGVRKAYQRAGVAPELIKYVLGWMGANGFPYCSMMVEKRNRALRWVISDLVNLEIVKEFDAYGRKMLLYRLPVMDNQAGALIPAEIEDWER